MRARALKVLVLLSLESDGANFVSRIASLTNDFLQSNILQNTQVIVNNGIQLMGNLYDAGCYGIEYQDLGFIHT